MPPKPPQGPRHLFPVPEGNYRHREVTGEKRTQKEFRADAQQSVLRLLYRGHGPAATSLTASVGQSEMVALSP